MSTWIVSKDGREIVNTDFTNDATLELTGDFQSAAHRMEYANLLADKLNARRAALAEQDEPVAVVEMMKTGGNAGLATRIVEIDDHLRERLRPGTKLYTHPAPQRKPLTDNEIIAVRKATRAQGYAAWSDSIAFAFAVIEVYERKNGIGEQK